MLTHAVQDSSAFFAALRQREFARLDAGGIAYLDYAGSGLYGDSQIRAQATRLARHVFGNPHSEHGSSQVSARAITEARRRVLRFLDADDDYTVIFTANATAAIKLIAEAYPFERHTPCVLTADNHNSVNGLREFARRRGAEVVYVPLRGDMRLDHPEARLGQAGDGLFAFPAQSNFSGVHHPLSLIRTAQSLGYHVLLDAAAYAPAHRLSLRTHPADFVALSFYKLFGYPTGVGALVARRESLAAVSRPWFSGGTVEYASVQLNRHTLRAGHEGFEDGTPSFLDIAGLEDGFDLRDRIGADRIEGRVEDLTRALLDGLGSLRHSAGEPMVRIYGPHDTDRRGGTIAFNVLDRDGIAVPYGLVEDRAAAAEVHVRGGCFCNPGAAEAAFGLDAARMSRCLDALDGHFSSPALQRCLGREQAVGAVRASIGLASNARDIHRALDVVASFAS
jgi:selenocysteine lyase/cysteine desulfurase